MYGDNGENARAEVQRNMPGFMWLIIIGIPAIALIAHWLGDGLNHTRQSKAAPSAHVQNSDLAEPKHEVAAKK